MNDWNVVTIGSQVTIERGFAFRSSDYSNEGHFVLRVTNLAEDGRANKNDAVYLNDRKVALYPRYQLSEGDILLVMVGATTGKIARVTIDVLPALLNQNIWNLKPATEELYKPFFYFSLHDIIYRFLASSQGSARDFLKQSDFKNICFELPPLPQQRKIARILTTVDNLIEKTEALIAKYQAMKQGMMHDLFTRGVDEHGHLRPPYEEAPELYKESELGWIPKEWEVTALRECTGSLITYGIVQAGPHIEGGVPYIRTGDMGGNRLHCEEMLCTSPAIAKAFERSEVHVGEIVCAIRATVGKVLEVPPELDGANLTQGTARISPKSSVDSSFLLWAIRSEAVQRLIQQAIKGTTFAEITLAQLREIAVPIPKSRTEQSRISDSLNSCEHRMESERNILENLRRQKNGLMQDLLTGKIRVKADEAEEVVAHA